MAVLNQNGVEIRKLDQIIKDLQDIAKRRFAPLVAPDDELDVSDSSVLGIVLGIVAESDTLNEELILQLWQSLDPEQAESIFLDKILELVSIKRQGAVRGYAGLIMKGEIGKTVPEGAKVSSRTTGVVFETIRNVTFSQRNACGIVLRIPTVTAGKTISLGYSSLYGLNTYPTINTMIVEGDTRLMVATRLRETINNSSSVIRAEVDLDDNVVVRFINENTFGDFTTGEDAKIIQSYMAVSSISIEEEAPKQPANSLTVMQTSTVGWIEVTNPFESISSKPEETDRELRERARLIRGLQSVGNRVALYANLNNLAGVDFVNIRENVNENATSGRSAKGISVIVFGGDEDEIADTISRTVPLGCLTDGLIRKVVYDQAGSTEIRFSRPEIAPIAIEISMKTDSSFPQNGRILMQEALIEYFNNLQVGSPIIWSQLFTPLNKIQGHSINSLRVGIKGQMLDQRNVDLVYNQLPTLSFEDIKI